jgi:uncharacterized membrane protein YhaH (DUF805 family)
VSFPDAVTTVYTKKYADFSGRARRSEFWFGYLAYVLAGIVVDILARVLDSRIPVVVLFLAAVVPFLASGARRLHDTGRSGWWLLLILTFFGILVLIVWMVSDSEPNDNQYGPSPKGGVAYNQAPDANWGQS